MCLLAAETSVSSLSTIPLNHGSRVVKSLKQNRAKSRIAWNNVVPANVHEEDWPPSIVMGAWLQSTLHTGPAPCLYQYLSFACTQAHDAEYCARCLEEPMPVVHEFTGNGEFHREQVSRNRGTPSFHPTLVAMIFRISLFRTFLKNFISRDSDKLIDLLLLLLLRFV